MEVPLRGASAEKRRPDFACSVHVLFIENGIDSNLR